MDNFYELLRHNDPRFPIIFHYDTVRQSIPSVALHWHEAVEILLVTRGRVSVRSDSLEMEAGEGEMVVIGSRRLHSIRSLTRRALYYCLIVDRPLFDGAGIEQSRVSDSFLVTEEEVCTLYRRITEEFRRKKLYYKIAVKAEVTLLLSLLCRLCENIPVQEDDSSGSLAMVKEAVHYLHLHFNEPITVTALAERCGYSKYYFCRVFREVTGSTPIDFLNALRCDRAEALLTEGMCVSEAAAACGFENLSYFSRTFRRYRGRLPSAVGNNS